MQSNSVNAALFVLWIALLAVIALLWFNPPQAAEAVVSPGSGLPASALRSVDVASEPPPLALAPIEEYQEIVDRPLFFQARKPPEPEVEKPPEPAPAPVQEDDELLLIGVMRVGEERTALVQNQTTGKVSAVKVGESLAGDSGWKAESIEANQISLSRNGGESKQLELLRNKRKPSMRISKQVERLRQQRQLARRQRELARRQQQLDGQEQVLPADQQPADGEPLQQQPADQQIDQQAQPEQLTQEQAQAQEQALRDREARLQRMQCLQQQAAESEPEPVLEKAPDG